MYCQNCGTVNQSGLARCAKCGHDLRNQERMSEVDMALAARSQVKTRSSSSGISTVILFGVIVLGALFIISIVIMSRQVKNAYPVLTRTDKPAVDREPGFGGASPEAVNRDAGRKANSLKVKNALEQYYAVNDRYPDSLDQVDGSVLGFVPDAAYSYQVLANGKDFRVEIVLETGTASGADIVHEGDVTKVVVTSPSR